MIYISCCTNHAQIIIQDIISDYELVKLRSLLARTDENNKTANFDQNRSKNRQTTAPYGGSSSYKFYSSNCSIAWARWTQTLRPGSSGQQPLNQPITHWARGQFLWQNQRSKGLCELNSRPIIQARLPRTTGAAAENSCSCSLHRSLRENFHRPNRPPSPNPITCLANLTAEPYNRQTLQPPNPTTAEPYNLKPYNQALAKSKRWQSIQSKLTHPPIHQPPPTKQAL